MISRRDPLRDKLWWRLRRASVLLSWRSDGLVSIHNESQRGRGRTNEVRSWIIPLDSSSLMTLLRLAVLPNSLARVPSNRQTRNPAIPSTSPRETTTNKGKNKSCVYAYAIVARDERGRNAPPSCRATHESTRDDPPDRFGDSYARSLAPHASRRRLDAPAPRTAFAHRPHGVESAESVHRRLLSRQRFSRYRPRFRSRVPRGRTTRSEYRSDPRQT